MSLASAEKEAKETTPLLLTYGNKGKKKKKPQLPSVVAKRGFSQSASTYEKADEETEMSAVSAPRQVVLRRRGDEDLYSAPPPPPSSALDASTTV